MSALVEVYAEDFTRALPGTSTGRSGFATLAALRKIRTSRGGEQTRPPRCVVLMEVARRGHVPGTKEYYLIPREGTRNSGFEEYTNKRMSAKGARQEVTMHRRLSGESFPESTELGPQSVIVELVKSKDRFTFNPGLHDRPSMRSTGSGTGRPGGVYAYAVMHDRAIPVSH